PSVNSALHVAPTWLGTLIDHSNLRFTGAYIMGDPLASSTRNDFTKETMPTTAGSDRQWMENVGNLRAQGWGIVFWYFGLSNLSIGHWPAGIVDNTNIATARVYGILH